MVFYFTGTGNSLFVAKQLDSEMVSIPQALKRKELEYTAETVGFVFPVYSGEPPLIVREFIKKVRIYAKYVYMVLTYGNDETVAVKVSKAFAEENGIRVDYIAKVKTVDNFLPVFDASQQIKIDKKCGEQIKAVSDDIRIRRHSIPKVKIKGRILYAAVKKMHNAHPEQINGEALAIKESCIGCGICTQVCQRGILKIENGKAVRQKKACEFCLSCVNNCPEKAIGFSTGEKNPNARYRNESITLDEIIKANNQLKENENE